jgi:hypothetical protein
MSVVIGLLVGVGEQPRPEDLDALIADGAVPEEGVRFVTLTLGVDEASRRAALVEYYRGACVQQGWVEGLAFAGELRFADLVVHGRRIVVVLPKAAVATRPQEPAAGTFAAPGRPDVGADPTAVGIERALSQAGPTTLQGCDRILAVVVMHERPVPIAEDADPGTVTSALTPQRVARGLVDDYKRPGWVPADLVVDDEVTAITILRRPDTGQLSTRDANAILAGALAGSLVGRELPAYAAISFSGENDVFGHTRLAILAATATPGPTAEGVARTSRRSRWPRWRSREPAVVSDRSPR